MQASDSKFNCTLGLFIYFEKIGRYNRPARAKKTNKQAKRQLYYDLATCNMHGKYDFNLNRALIPFNIYEINSLIIV